MKNQVLAQFPLTGLTVFALVLFFAVFVGMLFRLSRRPQAAQLDLISRLPFEEAQPGILLSKEENHAGQ